MATPEEADAKVRLFTVISFVWFLAAMGVWCALGYIFVQYYYDPQYEFDTASRDLFISMASMFIIFGVLSLIFGLIGFAGVRGPMKDDKYDVAYNRCLLFGLIGLFFGMGAGIMMVLAARKYIKTHPKYLATLPVPTPICERCGQPVQFDKEEGGWYCPTCKIHLTKGTPKPKAPTGPILPPVPPPKPQPKPGYGPPGTHHGMPPQQGAPGQQPPGHHGPMGPPPPKPVGPPPYGGPPGGPPPKPGMAPPPKPMGPPPYGGPPGGPPPKPGMAPPPKPLGPPPYGGPPGGPPPKPGMVPPPKPVGPPPQGSGPPVRSLVCGHCGKNFQWNMADPSVRVAKCPWCNNQVPL